MLCPIQRSMRVNPRDERCETRHDITFYMYISSIIFHIMLIERFRQSSPGQRATAVSHIQMYACMCMCVRAIRNLSCFSSAI